ncbi:MAG: ATP synthase F1 subunit delta [Terriglobia bacterium]|nr:MAG: ATP synthase F1 subunit delta [Terriglobia bacterium]
MTVSAIGKRYAQALADVVTAPSSGVRAENIASELSGFDAVLQSSPELFNALISPAVPSSRKKAALARLAEVLVLSRISRNFLFVLIDHRRMPELSQILQAFELVMDERLGFARAEVVSAGDLNDNQRSTLNRKLEELTGKRIRMRFTVDPSLIGGVVARIGSTVYDGSLRGQLSVLGRRLSGED